MIATQFEVSGFHRIATEDHYHQGEFGPSSDSYVDYHIKAKTLQEMREKIASVVGGTLEDQDLNSCDEPGRVDVQMLENADGLSPTASQYAKWIEGEYRLWSVTYTFYVESVTRQPATFGA